MWYCTAWCMATEYFASLSSNSTRMGCSRGRAVSALRTPWRSHCSSHELLVEGSLFHGLSEKLEELDRGESKGETPGGTAVEELAGVSDDPHDLQRVEGIEAKQLHSSPQGPASGQQPLRPLVVAAHCADICSWNWRLSSACVITEPTSSSCTGRHRPCTPRSSAASLQPPSWATSSAALDARSAQEGSSLLSSGASGATGPASTDAVRFQILLASAVLPSGELVLARWASAATVESRPLVLRLRSEALEERIRFGFSDTLAAAASLLSASPRQKLLKVSFALLAREVQLYGRDRAGGALRSPLGGCMDLRRALSSAWVPRRDGSLPPSRALTGSSLRASSRSRCTQQANTGSLVPKLPSSHSPVKPSFLSAAGSFRRRCP
mmetsp:Transcript_20783/g.62584  ORF Transcript_20783/g.62584 Transcript_20783/m.62584 type:complete len:381 (+) Transcript_20783:1031-2173(+)